MKSPVTWQRAFRTVSSIRKMSRGNSTMLLENGANVNAENESYGNALSGASCRGREGAVQLLLENGADEGNPPLFGNPLSASSKRCHEELVQLLLETESSSMQNAGAHSRRRAKTITRPSCNCCWKTTHVSTWSCKITRKQYSGFQLMITGRRYDCTGKSRVFSSVSGRSEAGAPKLQIQPSRLDKNPPSLTKRKHPNPTTFDT